MLIYTFNVNENLPFAEKSCNNVFSILTMKASHENFILMRSSILTFDRKQLINVRKTDLSTNRNEK